MKKHDIAYINTDKLELDFDNPRFAELYSGSHDQNELIEYLLYNESAADISQAIADADEFYTDRPLWVLKQKNGNYLVKDGNRRCAAVKALQMPAKYGLNVRKMPIPQLPVLIYDDKDQVEKRILQEHTASLFREWDRIAKALEVYKMHTSGSSLDALQEIDSKPADLVKLASFYYEAVKIGSDDLRQLLRRGRGDSGGKTIIFERLFRDREKCGYTFKPKPSYEVKITDKNIFSKYIAALVEYLKDHPNTTATYMDSHKDTFLDELKVYGFMSGEPNKKTDFKSSPAGDETEDPQQTSSPADDKKSGGKKRKTIKTRPVYERKQLPRPLEKLIGECYDLDPVNFANAKTALVRVSFECTLKFVVENTKDPSGKKLSDSRRFHDAYFNRHGNKRPTTDFEILKTRFTELITNTGTRKAFEDFKLDNPHQIIHNYNVGAVPANATSLCDNLIPLLEFMLQEQADLLSSLDLVKL